MAYVRSQGMVLPTLNAVRGSGSGERPFTG